MKFREIFRFELTYQLRRPWPWIAWVILIVFSLLNTRIGILPVTLPQDFVLNSPFIIACVSVISCLIWLLVASPIAGEAAARDMQTGIHPLMYTTPVSKIEYLGGRFFAAFVLNALVLLGVQIGSLLAVYGGGIDPQIIGPFRPASYLAAYAFIALPNAFIATSFQFAAALWSGRSLASYFGSIILFFLTIPVPLIVYFALGLPKVALMMDPIGMLAIMNEMMLKWTIVEKNVRMFTLEGHMFWNRLLWLIIASMTFTFVYLRFRFSHYTSVSSLLWLTRRFSASAKGVVNAETLSVDTPLPQVPQSFGFVTDVRQTVLIATSSFSTLAKSVAGLFLLIVFPLFVVLVLVVQSEHWGIQLAPWTGYILSKDITSSLTQASDFRVMIPLIIIYLSGELVWRERDAQLGDHVDTAPVQDWVFFLGKFFGVCMVLAALMVGLTAAGIVAQMLMGYNDFRVSLYLQILFGLQLPEYVLFAMLTFAVLIIVNNKHVGMLVMLVAYVSMILAPLLGIKHNLLIYGAGPKWSFTDIRGFASSVGPWLWFKTYWAAWAMLLAVITRILWIRGRESGFRTRLRTIQHRLTPATISIAVVSLTLILTLGGFILYNTNVRNTYISDDALVQRKADYERLYGKYKGVAQPQRSATKLKIEIYPKQKTATIYGSYRLINRGTQRIDSLHIGTTSFAETSMTLDRPAKLAVEDHRLSHFIYVLGQPLEPGDSITLNFNVKLNARGFSNDGADLAVIENGSYFTSDALPVIGYQSQRELWGAEERREQGLPRQVTLPPPSDIDPGVTASAPTTFEAIISTEAGQVAVAPGELKRSWLENNRQYFQFESHVPIGGLFVFASAKYNVHRERWNDVDIQIFSHPSHTKHLDSLLRSIKESLRYYSKQFGEYPFPFLQVIEQPGNFFGMGVDGSGVLTAGEGFFRLDPKGESFDAIFEIAAHEMGHQWWGTQLKPAFAEGGGVISESLAWYSAMQLVKNVKGREALRQFMSFMREPNPWPQIRTGLPLLRAMDPWANYRKGPYAMHALNEYVGEDQVNRALRTLIIKKDSTLATTMDLYRELQAVTPDSVKPLLHDLFEVNAFWKFDTKQSKAEQTKAGTWQVTFEFDAHKFVADSAGFEKEIPVDQWVEVGVFGEAKKGEILGAPLYLQKHFIQSGLQTITITVPGKPARGGIDPYNLLDWDEGDNIEPIKL